MNKLDIGAVTAYAMAVEQGYEGTEEEFAALQAESGNNALRAENAADRAQQILDNIPLDFQEVSKGVAALLVEAFNLESDHASVIPDGTDFDTLMTPGNFKIQTMDSGATMLNSPVPNAGRLLVMRTSQHDRVLQMYIANTEGSRLFIRIYDDVWSEWDEIAKRSEVTAVSSVASSAMNLESDNASVIPDGTDFDTLMTPGNYKVLTISAGSTMLNAPNANGGRLTVLRTSQNDRLFQVYLANTDAGRIFWRAYDGKWGAWNEMALAHRLAETIARVETLQKVSATLESDSAYVIPDGTDFDTLTEPGNFKVQTFAAGKTMINAPTDQGGRLTVMRTSQHGKVLQVYVANMATPTIFVRMNDGVWSAWEKLVTSSVTDALTAKVAALTELSSAVPDYYDATLTEKARKINMELASAGADGDAFVFITDIHEKPLYTPQTMQHICRETNIRKIINNGDVTKDKDTKAEVLPLLNKYYNLYNFPGCDLYKVVGNHEFNNGGGDDEYADRQLSADELYQTIFGGNANAVTIDPAGTLAYYFDDPAAKMRYFVCAVNYKSTVNYESINWIIAELENVPADYDVVLFCHHGLNSAGEYTTYISRLVGALDAYKAHTTYTNDYNKETYDYTQKSGEVICMCVGDEHKDLSRISDGGIPIIATTCASVNEELGGLDRVAGTTSESAYDVYVINRKTRTINVTRIGAGSDRAFTY